MLFVYCFFALQSEKYHDENATLLRETHSRGS